MRYSESDVRNLKERVSELEHIVKLYEEQLRIMAKGKYGSSSERSRYDRPKEQIGMGLVFNEAESVCDEADKEGAEPVSGGHARRKRTRKEMLPEGIPVIEVLHELPEEERVCPECGGAMHAFGHETRDELVIVPAKVTIRRHRTIVYGCRKCEQASDHVPIKKPKAPSPVIKGGFASPEAIAHVATQKYVMGSPLYRQEQEWRRKGVILTRQTTSNWLIDVAERLLSPIADELKSDLVRGSVMHADETTLQVLREPGKSPQSKSHMWEYRTGSDAACHIVLYDYQRDRKAVRPENFLRGFSGYLHTDGYAGYHNLPERIVVVGCWAHARRKWDEALKAVPEGKRAGSAAWTGKRCCDRLFDLEREFAGLTAKERHGARARRSKPVMDEYIAWIKTLKATPKSLLGKAAGYSVSQWAYLSNVLLDGRLELSNNRAERSIKPFVISRKNFLFANTPRGACASAVIFSLIETAKENGIDPYGYLVYALSRAPDTDMSDRDQVRALLPAAFKAMAAPRG